MLSVSAHHLGDSWFCVEGNRVHCYFLICPDTVPRHMAWDIAHASSPDLRNWTYHGVVLRRGSPGAWDGACLATGSVLRRGRRYWMAYTGNWFGPRPAVGMAVSSDLSVWEKLAANPVTSIDENSYASAGRGRRPLPHWRDPFLFEVDGVAHQLVCATAAHDDTGAGTVGAARSRDLITWEILPPLDIEPFSEELECPQVVADGDRFYLVFSTPAGLLLSDTGDPPEAAGHMYSMIGDTPLGPFRVADPAKLFPDDMSDRPYAGRMVTWEGRPYLLGTVWSDEGDHICDPIPVELTAKGVKACI